MRVFRILAALITVFGVVAPVSGCGSGPGGAGATVAGTTPSASAPLSVPGDPKEQLAAGIRALNSATFRVAGSQTLRNAATKTEGVADPARRAMRITQVVGTAGSVNRADTVMLGTDLFIRYDKSVLPGIQPGKWTHVDGRRVKSAQSLGVGGSDDMSGKRELVELLTSAERVGPRELRGTADLTKSRSLRAAPVDVFGDAARSVPWQARFDEQGRLIWLSSTIPANGDRPPYTDEFAYSGIGEPVTVERPPARDTVEAPESLYTIFGQ